MAEKKRIYVLFAHTAGNADFEVNLATDDAEKMREYLDSELDYSDIFYCETEEDMTAESIDRHSQYDLGVDFGYDIVEYRMVLKSMEVDVPVSGQIWGVFANGYEVYSWQGEMIGLFASKEEAMDFIIQETTVNEEEAEDALDSLTQCGSYSDADWTHWELVPFSVE